ncbi:MAG: ATP-grasp fold amidoligase family protein [Actinomyces sp.]|uniref:ATP-grasp fold amidoligase family protein n=1 Tax=Actinomyces sp. TaxID=29317 RepID=UPI0026DB50BF|nr:ATP-grasp fold amidoligase family protein [Actinomyces sp.]MDO4243414.1 ATP-grasp fold amidoligase family protein [Actinomyces sp.]
MSTLNVKDVTLCVLPEWAETALRRAVYHWNCQLSPEQYRIELQRWYRLTKGRDCDLDSPRTMGEKIQWLKLYDSTPLKGRLADKYLVRQWVADTIGPQYLPELLGVWDSPELIDFDALPDSFVLKATHGSGWNVIVKDKSTLDVERTRRRLATWLGRRASMAGGFQLHYDFCEPRIIGHPYMADDSGGLRDYKFFTFDGRVQFALGIEGRFVRKTLGAYLPDWSRAPFDYGYNAEWADSIPRPSGLETMVALAEELGRGFPLARVDFYEVDGRVYFGEITFTDNNGLADFFPSSFDHEFSQRLSLPEQKAFKGVLL